MSRRPHCCRNLSVLLLNTCSGTYHGNNQVTTNTYMNTNTGWLVLFPFAAMTITNAYVRPLLCRKSNTWNPLPVLGKLTRERKLAAQRAPVDRYTYNHVNAWSLGRKAFHVLHHDCTPSSCGVTWKIARHAF